MWLGVCPPLHALSLLVLFSGILEASLWRLLLRLWDGATPWKPNWLQLCTPSSSLLIEAGFLSGLSLTPYLLFRLFRSTFRSFLRGCKVYGARLMLFSLTCESPTLISSGKAIRWQMLW
ncbi:hypothetical protein ACS0TY_010803 [Phlomoides rotata]